MSPRKGTVLVVDADPATGRAALAALPSEQRRVLTATCVREALALLGAERVDVLVAELVLPDGSGLRLLAEARRLHPDVARIALTAVEDFAAAVAAINEAEVLRLLRKPVEGPALHAAVEEALARSETFHEAQGASEAAERRRVALVDLESHHPGIALVSLGPDGYFLTPQRIKGLAARLEGDPVGRALGAAIAAARSG
jgi:two-component system response regulator PhcR